MPCYTWGPRASAESPASPEMGHGQKGTTLSPVMQSTLIGEPGTKPFIHDPFLDHCFILSRAALSLQSPESQPSDTQFVLEKIIITILRQNSTSSHEKHPKQIRNRSSFPNMI